MQYMFINVSSMLFTAKFLSRQLHVFFTAILHYSFNLKLDHQYAIFFLQIYIICFNRSTMKNKGNLAYQNLISFNAHISNIIVVHVSPSLNLASMKSLGAGQGGAALPSAYVVYVFNGSQSGSTIHMFDLCLERCIGIV
ncbi:hypothetical protein ACJX0J_034014 [Zea mays]